MFYFESWNPFHHETSQYTLKNSSANAQNTLWCHFLASQIKESASASVRLIVSEL